MQEKILHALDLCMLGDLQGAKEAIEHEDSPVAERLVTLITQLQEEQSRRESLQKTGRHELGNALSIAQANLEAMIDGVLEVTPQRLRDIRESLRTAGALLVDLKESPLPVLDQKPAAQSFDLAELLAAQIAMVRGAADPKNVALIEGNPETIARQFREALLDAVRRTEPGGKITVRID
jgi:two-component system sensor histidine kinase BaeS